MPKFLRKIRVAEVSSCDVGAGMGCKVILRKRHDGDEERVMRTVTKRQIVEALRGASWSDLEAIAKRLVPGVDGPTALHRAGAIVDGWNGLLARCLAKSKLGAASSPQIYGGPSHADLPHANEPDEDGDVDDEDQPDYHHDHGKPKIVRRKKMSGRGASLNNRSSLMHCDDDDEDEDNLHREHKKGFGRARRPATETDREETGHTHADNFDAGVKRIMREQGITYSQAVDRALREPGVREHYDRDMAKARAANAMNRI
jgi:hypothetical protein